MEMKEMQMKQTHIGQFDYLHDKFILDSGSTLRATIKNQDLVINIRKSDDPINMVTNASNKLMDFDGNIPGL